MPDDMNQEDILEYVFTLEMDAPVNENLIIEAILYTLYSQEVRTISGKQYREVRYRVA